MATQVEPIKMTRQGRVAVTDLVVQTEADNERALATIKELSAPAHAEGGRSIRDFER